MKGSEILSHWSDDTLDVLITLLRDEVERRERKDEKSRS